MANFNNDVDWVSAPEDYADFFTTYWEYTLHLLGQFGIDENNREDVASEICMRFLERGSLEKFDPDLSFPRKGEMRAARFKSYFSRAVDFYSRGHRDKQYRLARREWQICDVDYSPSAREGVAMVGALPWVELFGDVHEDHADKVHDMIDEQAEADGIRALLARVEPRSAHDRCDLVALFDAVRVQVLTYGEYDIKLLKDKFGVSTTAMHSWMWWLKENLAVIYGKPVPPKRPRRTRRDAQ